MDIELAATHEAGHSVMQWLVGWEIEELKMNVVASNASQVSAHCPYPLLNSMSALRKRLLVLFGGNAATRQRWPESNNGWGDWQAVLSALQDFFQRSIIWIVADGQKLRDAEANEVIVSTMSKCVEIVKHPRVQAAILRIATEFGSVSPSEFGEVRMDGHEVVSICEAIIGDEFRWTNPWSGWIAGK